MQKEEAERTVYYLTTADTDGTRKGELGDKTMEVFLHMYTDDQLPRELLSIFLILVILVKRTSIFI